MLFISRDSFCVSCLVLEILAVENSASYLILSYQGHYFWKETLLMSFSNFWGCESHYMREKAEISMTDISKTRQLTPKLSRLMNSTTGKMKCIFDFGVSLLKVLSTPDGVSH